MIKNIGEIVTPYLRKAGLSLASGYLESRDQRQSTKLMEPILHLKDVLNCPSSPIYCVA